MPAMRRRPSLAAGRLRRRQRRPLSFNAWWPFDLRSTARIRFNLSQLSHGRLIVSILQRNPYVFPY